MADAGQAQRASQDLSTTIYVGHHESQRTAVVTPSFLGQAHQSGYDMLTAPLTTPHFQSRVLSTLQAYVKSLQDANIAEAVPMPTISPLMPEDTDLGPDESNIAIIGVVSPWIDLGSPDPLIAHISRQVFSLEVAYAAFVGIGNVLVYGPIDGADQIQYARAILEALGLGPYVQLQILLPMTGELELEGADGAHLSELARDKYLTLPLEDDEEEPELFGSWEIWDSIRTMCQYSNKLTVALELPRRLPSLELQSRWFSEPVRALVLPRTTFLRNQSGFPVLEKTHQQLLYRFLRLKFAPWVLLADVGPIEAPDGSGDTVLTREPTPAEAALVASKSEIADPIAHLRYIRRLQQTQPIRPPVERFGQGYQDYVQSPLQPLTDNLESVTYEVFEKDPVKYEWYERAVAAALKDIRAKLGDDKRPIVCAVAGAGRGPLVTRILRASKSTAISIVPCAIEKNPNAHVLIQRRNNNDPLWNKQVLVYKSDMRSWPGPMIDGQVHKVDILVSELLGSFADNELSPECLDGVQHVLHPDHGVNIPQSYSAHFTPIATPRLHSDLLSRSGDDKWELPAVVMLHQYDDLCRVAEADGQMKSLVFPELTPDIKEAWSFSHPLPPAILSQAEKRAGGTLDAGGFTGGDGKNEHNVRSCRATFTAPHRGVCHGLAGYFETVLYTSEDKTGAPIELSTNPLTMDRKSKDMISWFPIFFPLKTPLHVPDEAQMEVCMWRQTDDRKVWYEWLIEVYVKVGERKRRKVGGSDLHSSRKNGCLM